MSGWLGGLSHVDKITGVSRVGVAGVLRKSGKRDSHWHWSEGVIWWHINSSSGWVASKR